MLAKEPKQREVTLLKVNLSMYIWAHFEVENLSLYIVFCPFFLKKSLKIFISPSWKTKLFPYSLIFTVAIKINLYSSNNNCINKISKWGSLVIPHPQPLSSFHQDSVEIEASVHTELVAGQGPEERELWSKCSTVNQRGMVTALDAKPEAWKESISIQGLNWWASS